MPLDPSIVLSGRRLTPSQDIERQRRSVDLQNLQRQQGLETGRQRQELTDLQIQQQRIANLDARDQQRLKSSFMGLARLKPFLDTNNQEGALSELQRRRGQLEELGIDTFETDQMIQMVQDDFQGAKEFTDLSVASAQNLGFLPRPSGSFATSAMRNQQALQKALSEGDTLGATAIARTLGMIGQGQQLNEQGQVVSMEGFGQALQDVERAKQTGRKQVELELEPQIQQRVTGSREQEKRRQEAIRDLPNIESNANITLSLIDDLISDEQLGLVFGVIDAVTPDLSQKANDLQAKIDRLDSQVFLTQFEKLKGGGQITEREGQAAREALLNAKRAQSVEQFIQNALIVEQVLQKGLAQSRSLAETGLPLQMRQQDQPQRTTDEFQGFEVVE